MEETLLSEHKPVLRKYKIEGWEFDLLEGKRLIETSKKEEIEKKLEIYNSPDMMFDTYLHVKKEGGFEMKFEPVEAIPFCYVEVLRKAGISEIQAFPSKEWEKHQKGSFVNYEGYL